MKRANQIAIGVLLVTLCSIVLIALTIWNRYNPPHKGRRAYDWAEIAMWDENPNNRRNAVDALMEILPTMHGEERAQLLLRFCRARVNTDNRYPPPNELLTFFVAVLKAEEEPANTYATIALTDLFYYDEAGAELRLHLEQESDVKIRARIGRAIEMLKPRK